jgi:hypothetical protein
MNDFIRVACNAFNTNKTQTKHTLNGGGGGAESHKRHERGDAESTGHGGW